MLKKFFQNACKPKGFGGSFILGKMNYGHAPMAKWGFSHINPRPHILNNLYPKLVCALRKAFVKLKLRQHKPRGTQARPVWYHRVKAFLILGFGKATAPKNSRFVR